MICGLPRPLDVLRPLGAPAIGPPPRTDSRSTAALFTDMEKFLCKQTGWRGHKGVSFFFFFFALHFYLFVNKKKVL